MVYVGEKMRKFDTLAFKDSTLRFIENMKFIETTPIQEAVIPYILKGKDIIGISETGTGKTHAFLIPIMEKINTKDKKTQAVIIAPTRELAMQTFQFAKEMKNVDQDLNLYLAVGGKGKEEFDTSNPPHLVIGTPGRLKDLFLNEQILRLDQANLVVLDETDMIFELDFLQDVDEIISKIPKVQLLAFSATIPQTLKLFLKKYMTNPKTIQIENHETIKSLVKNILVPAKHLKYEEKLHQILPGFQPYVCLIFANTREDAEHTANYLRSKQYKILELHGNLTARQRKNALKTLKSHEYTYIVATDVAARGLDIEGVTHVVSLGFPSDLNFFIHRSGRTGRNKRNGICYAIYKDSDQLSIKKLQDKGVSFQHSNFTNNHWVELKPIFQKRIKKDAELEKEISLSLKRKNEKVKPNYKKKRNQQVEKIKQKKKRELIRSEIKSSQKQRAKTKQLKKGEN